MISRARYGIEYIKRNIEYSFRDDLIEKISRTFDVNYDMQDIQLSYNILEDFKDSYFYNKDDINQHMFLNQENNDGKLFVDCDQNSREIKYCFTDSELNILNPHEYMQWNIGIRWDKKDFNSDPEWNKISSICKKNIKSINDNATLMSDIELKHFITDNYSKQINEVCVEKDIKI